MRLRILLVEGNAEERIFLKEALLRLRAPHLYLLESPPEIALASSLSSALLLLKKEPFDLILTNIELPDQRGEEVFLALQKEATSVPILLLSVVDDETAALKLLRLGAQDYLVKAEITSLLLARVVSHAIERQRLQEDLRRLSITDELTGVYNRRGFFTLVKQQLELAQESGYNLCLFLIDLDFLKQINDQYGHLAGDHALLQLVQCLKSAFQPQDIIGRIGGDEFAVAAFFLHKEEGRLIKEQLHVTVETYNREASVPYLLSFSVGMAYFDHRTPSTIDLLLQEADKELYQEKKLHQRR